MKERTKKGVTPGGRRYDAIRTDHATAVVLDSGVPYGGHFEKERTKNGVKKIHVESATPSLSSKKRLITKGPTKKK